jgi:predicted nucleic acid-binding protein
LTGVVDTRLLLALEFPQDQTGPKIRDFFEKEIGKHLLAPSIILTEFIEIAGKRIGEDAAKTKIRLLREKGMRILALDEEEAMVAGNLLLCHHNVPIADALIASFVKIGAAEYVVTDDPHFKALGVRTKWF